MSARFAQADAVRLPFADDTFALTFCSPPYLDARTYGIGAQRKCEAWINWMLDVLIECQRVTTGPVVVVAAGVTRKRNYQPGCEGLMYRWWQRGGNAQLYRPCYWHRVGIPGSGGTDWFRADVEYVMCFKRPGELPWSDNTACGHAPKWAPGGEMSHRLSTGARVNQWGHPIGTGGTTGSTDDVTCGKPRPSHFMVSRRRKDGSRQMKEIVAGGTVMAFPAAKREHTKKLANGDTEYQVYIPPTIANPGNLVRTNVGGGLLGHPIAHENEAPFPERLAEFFIKSLCPPGGRVLDPFSGSGTTACVAAKLGRIGIGTDLRFCQCKLGWRRWNSPIKHKPRRLKPNDDGLLFQEPAHV